VGKGGPLGAHSWGSWEHGGSPGGGGWRGQPAGAGACGIGPQGAHRARGELREEPVEGLQELQGGRHGTGEKR